MVNDIHMENGEDLGIGPEIPFLQKILKFISTIMRFLFLNPRSFWISDLIWVILLVIIVSSTLRFYLDNIFFNIGIVIALLIFTYFAWAYLLIRFILPWFIRLLFGGPVFDKLGGNNRKSFFTALKCANALKYEFKGKDLKTIKEFNKLDIEIIEEILKTNYRKKIYKSDSTDSEDFESKWSKVWNEKILDISTEGISYRDFLSEDKFASRTIGPTMAGSTIVIAPLVKTFQLIMIYLIFSLINGSIEVLTVIQAGVLLSFILSIIWFIHHSYQITEIPLFVENLPEEIKEKFSDRLKQFLGKTVIPKKIIVKNRYFSLMRNYQARCMATVFLNSMLILVLVGIILIIGVLSSLTNIGDMTSWYAYFSIGVILLPFAFITGFYLTSMIIQNFRQLLAPIILGLLAVVLPFAITYLFTGYFEFIEIKNVILSFISGLTVALATIIASLIGRRLEKEEG
jgi:hypothetical protein